MPPAPTCICGECRKCRGRESARRSRQRHPLTEEQRAAARERARAHHAANRDKRLARARKLARENPGMSTPNVRRWRDANREHVNADARERYRNEDAEARAKRRARQRLNDAVRRGQLERQPCEVCGAEAAQGHHDDYSRPLDVRWLCARHHTDEHMDEAA